ncbi:hypothetical protein IJ707_04805, partial [bacterium]|nr:hypothetical protein [bacterium]
MFKEILSIFTPKGELAGIPFFINYIILRIVGLIVNYLGLYISFNDLGNIPIFKALAFILFILNIIIVLILIFNYKRRLLNITGNPVVSIILAVLLTAVLDLFILLIYFRPILSVIELAIIPLTLSVLPSKTSDKKEYWTVFLNRVKKFFTNPAVIFVVVMLIADFVLIKYSVFKNKQISEIVPDEKMETLVINPLSSYSGKTKDEILKIRKDFVATSIFKNDSYEPSEMVFGQIADKKPWWSIDHILCTNKNIDLNKRGEGLSEESRYLNNPNLLVGVQLSKSFIKNKDLKDFCEDKSLLFIPKEIKFDKKNKLIIVTYNASENMTKKMNKRYIEYLLVGLNARDFGYEWVYASNSHNLIFLPSSLDSTLFNEKPKKFLDFIHLGNACKVDGGCNNASPYQPEMAFYFRKFPADMTLSLWKNKPIYKNQPADIYLKMIF